MHLTVMITVKEALRFFRIQRWRMICLTLVLVFASFLLPAEERFEVLVLPSQIYSNVNVIFRTGQDVFITHSLGLANVKVKDLDEKTKRKLGYEQEPSEPIPRRPVFEGKMVLDPKVRELQQAMVKEIEDKIKKAAPILVAGILGGLILFYFFYCYCCMLICRKTGHEPGIMVWIPVLQAFPLLKAAGMSPGWFILFLLPVGNLIGSITWCVKIAKARQKSLWVALFLLLPVTSIFAFLYLAFSDGNEGVETEDEPSGKLVYQR